MLLLFVVYRHEVSVGIHWAELCVLKFVHSSAPEKQFKLTACIITGLIHGFLHERKIPAGLTRRVRAFYSHFFKERGITGEPSKYDEMCDLSSCTQQEFSRT